MLSEEFTCNQLLGPQVVLSDTFPTRLLTFGGLFHEVDRRFVTATGTVVSLGTSLVRHGVVKRDLNVGVLLSGKRIEVRSHDRRLSEIVLCLLQDYFGFILADSGGVGRETNLKAMRDMLGQI